MTAFLQSLAAQRLHLKRLPADAPERNPGEGLWHQLKGVERRHVCCFNSPRLTREVRDAVKRVRRRPRLITSFFRGAKLWIVKTGSVNFLMVGLHALLHPPAMFRIGQADALTTLSSTLALLRGTRWQMSSLCPLAALAIYAAGVRAYRMVSCSALGSFEKGVVS